MKDLLSVAGICVTVGFLLGLAVGRAINIMPPTTDDDKATLAGLQAQATAMSNVIWQSDKVTYFFTSDWIEINRRAGELAKKIELQEKP